MSIVYSGVLESSSESTRRLIDSSFGQQSLLLLEDSAKFDAKAADRDGAMRHVKQRTDDWFSLREDGALSSSELANAFGFFTLQKSSELQQNLWKLVCLYTMQDLIIHFIVIS